MHAVLAVVIAVQLGAGVVAVVDRRGRDGGLDAASSAVVAELKAFVESTRGLRFRKPVDVAVLDDDAFRRSLVGGGEPIEQSDTQVSLGVLRALGLLDAGAPAPSGELDPATVAGFYDTRTKQLVVRGPELTPFVRQVLVHELTHALDDQHFELNPLLFDQDAALAFEALVEGDAVIVEARYLASLPEAERRAAAAEEDATFGAGAGAVPRVAAELGVFPYRDGPRFVDALLAAGGTGQVDGAFRMRPASTSEVLHPERFLDGPGRAGVTAVKPDGPALGDGVLGELILRLALAGPLPADRAARAAAGWAGDRYVAWAAGERTCLRTTVAMENAAEAAELAAGLRQWAGTTVDATRPPAVTLTRCA
jgi:hypothetical protein